MCLTFSKLLCSSLIMGLPFMQVRVNFAEWKRIVSHPSMSMEGVRVEYSNHWQAKYSVLFDYHSSALGRKTQESV